MESTNTREVLRRSDAVTLARAMALTTSIEIKHRYRMSRIEAEQKAIEFRLSRNFWRSRFVRRLINVLCVGIGLSLGWLASVKLSDTTTIADEQHAGQVQERPNSGASAPSVADDVNRTGLGRAEPSPLDDRSVEIVDFAVQDLVQIPFVRERSVLGKRGFEMIRQFAQANLGASRFQVTGISGVGETAALADERAKAVMDVFTSFGVESQSIELIPSTATMGDEAVRTGARLAALVQRPLGQQSISPIELLGSPTIGMGAPRTDVAVIESISPPMKERADSGEEVDDGGGKELASAVKAAANRQRVEKAPQTIKPKNALASKSAPARQTEPTPKVKEPTVEDNSSAAYSIISKLDGAVLLKFGREVWYVKVGEKLPDGKVLGSNLEPRAP